MNQTTLINALARYRLDPSTDLFWELVQGAQRRQDEALIRELCTLRDKEAATTSALEDITDGILKGRPPWMPTFNAGAMAATLERLGGLVDDALRVCVEEQPTRIALMIGRLTRYPTTKRRALRRWCETNLNYGILNDAALFRFDFEALIESEQLPEKSALAKIQQAKDVLRPGFRARRARRREERSAFFYEGWEEGVELACTVMRVDKERTGTDWDEFLKAYAFALSVDPSGSGLVDVQTLEEIADLPTMETTWILMDLAFRRASPRYVQAVPPRRLERRPRRPQRRR